MTRSHFWVDKGIKFVYLSGKTPYEVGLNHGKLLASDIKQVAVGIEKFLVDTQGPLLGKGLGAALLVAANWLKEKFTEEEISEMEGMAKGSGQDLKWFLFANSIYDLGASFHRFLKLTACSCFATRFGDSEEIVLGKTTDLTVPGDLVNLFTRHKIIFIHEHSWSKAKFLTPAWPMCLAGDSVLLENGLVMAFNDGGVDVNKKTDFDNPPIVGIIRHLAEYSQTKDEVLSNLKNLRTIKPFLCAVTDGTPKGTVSVELNQGDSQITEFGEHLIHSNHFNSQRMKKDHYYDDYEKNKIYQGSLKRYQNMEKKLKKVLSNLKEVTEVLKIHEKSLEINNGSVSNLGTVQGVIYYPSQKKMLFPSGNASPVTLFGEWTEFNFETIFYHGQGLLGRLRRFLGKLLPK